ncbi:uncharacterized protein LOC127102717 [Lathyrus oleraceus]|uniref:uncharacterized protein LOC127102717 n=1 Tax=Pisum sativum TaxID=3888 RepID=UPI0021CE8866|nr:uncharacterized protein LOC127102717 [Pisum sativum]
MKFCSWEKLKSIKLSRSKVWFVRRIHTYNEAAGNVVAPRVGFGLGSELRRAGVFVKVVKVGEKGNAADLWLEREMMSGEVGWLVLVSDDREFAEMLRKDRDLGKNADLWLAWNVVENGKVEGMGLMGRIEGSDDELEGDQNLGYDEYVTEEELLDDERWTMRVDLRGRSQDQSLSQSPNSIECQDIVGVDSEKRKTSMVMTLFSLITR